MKYVWEEHDIIAGRRFQAAHRPSEVWMVGYDPSAGDRAQYATISTVDGMISNNRQSKAALVNIFNSNGYRPMDASPDSDIGPWPDAPPPAAPAEQCEGA